MTTTSSPVSPGDERRRPLLGIGAVAERLGVQNRHVRRLVAERRIPFIKWGHLLRFDPVELERWIDSARIPPQEESRSEPAVPRIHGGSRVPTDRRRPSHAGGPDAA